MEFISLLDADTSGGISYAEFVQFVVNTIGPMTDQQLDYWTTDAEIFGDSDTDNSGEIEQGENSTSCWKNLITYLRTYFITV